MVNRAKFRKVKNDESSECWYCHKPTSSYMIFKSGEEVWACKKCAAREGKVKRLSKIPAGTIIDESTKDSHRKSSTNLDIMKREVNNGKVK